MPGSKVRSVKQHNVQQFLLDPVARIDATQQQINESPGYDPLIPANRAFEERFYDCCGYDCRGVERY